MADASRSRVSQVVRVQVVHKSDRVGGLVEVEGQRGLRRLCARRVHDGVKRRRDPVAVVYGHEQRVAFDGLAWDFQQAGGCRRMPRVRGPTRARLGHRRRRVMMPAQPAFGPQLLEVVGHRQPSSPSAAASIMPVVHTRTLPPWSMPASANRSRASFPMHPVQMFSARQMRSRDLPALVAGRILREHEPLQGVVVQLVLDVDGQGRAAGSRHDPPADEVVEVNPVGVDLEVADDRLPLPMPPERLGRRVRVDEPVPPALRVPLAIRRRVRGEHGVVPVLVEAEIGALDHALALGDGDGFVFERRFEKHAPAVEPASREERQRRARVGCPTGAVARSVRVRAAPEFGHCPRRRTSRSVWVACMVVKSMLS